MSKFNRKKIMPRYNAITIILALICLLVIGKTLIIMTAKRDYWMKVASRVKKDNLPILPKRGNILSCDGELLASSLPEYKLYMDFKALKQAKNDSLWDAKIDSVCAGLNQIFPDVSATAFKSNFEKGRKLQSQHWLIYDKKVDYNTYKEVKNLPLFRMDSNKGGFHTEEFHARQRPYGSLASRTVGDLYGGKDAPRFGLELSYDSILRGENGVRHRRKVLNRFLDIIDKPPVDGADIVTTIDVNMQDLAERAVIDELKEINGNVGVAIVMEVNTGDIKAIVNMEKCFDGKYRETKNHAVSDLLEPGSVFKTVSIMTALEDGVVDTTFMIDTGNGTWPMYGRTMKDHNWISGGYGTISLPKTLEKSSNIGVSRIIDIYYHQHPEKFVDGVYRSGIATDFHLPIVGSSPARIRKPHKNKRGQYTNWSKTALPWMSIGYETQIPPISTLAFYNAIANNGTMMRPRFVKQIVKDGEVLIDFPPEVVTGHEHICGDKTLKYIQTILCHVVSQGLGKKAGAKSFKVAGKTGTAQISKGSSGYKAGGTNYLLSFAGYFPADNPRYSCIVCIQKTGLPATGGGMSGVVFRHIAEGIMAQDIKIDAKDAKDSLSIFVPEVKTGNIVAADYVLSHLGINTNIPWNDTYHAGNTVWGEAKNHGNQTVSLIKKKQYGRFYVPDVKNMGARDAVFLMEKRGLKVKMSGRGKVVSQSLPPGKRIRKGETCQLVLK